MKLAWEEIARRCPRDRFFQGAEVGVWFGKTSAALLRALPTMHLYMIDWYMVLETPEERNRCSVKAHIGQSQKQMDDACESARKATLFAGDRRTIIISEAVAWAHRAGEASLYFAFLDADHTYDGTYAAMLAYWPLIQPGGFLCGHDYGHPSPDWGVAEAVHRFCESEALEFETGVDGTWFIRKPEDEAHD